MPRLKSWSTSATKSSSMLPATAATSWPSLIPPTECARATCSKCVSRSSESSSLTPTRTSPSRSGRLPDRLIRRKSPGLRRGSFLRKPVGRRNPTCVGSADTHDGVIEDPLVAAHRELEEETGYRAGTMERIGGFWSAPGFSTEYLTLYIATDLRAADEGRLEPDADENLQLSRLHWREAVAAVEGGVIEDAKTIAGILMLARRLEQGTPPIGVAT